MNFLMIGTDNLLYGKRIRLSETKQLIDDKINGLPLKYLKISQLKDDSFLTVGDDKLIYTKQFFYSQPVRVGTGNFLDFFQIQDGTFVGIGTDKQIYRKSKLTDDPVLAGKPGAAYLKFVQLQDGSYAGLGTDNFTYTKANVNDEPVRVGSGNYIDFIQLKDGSFALIGTGLQLYKKAKLSDNYDPNQMTPDSGIGAKYTKLFLARDGSLVLFATNYKIYTKKNVDDKDIFPSVDEFFIDFINNYYPPVVYGKDFKCQLRPESGDYLPVGVANGVPFCLNANGDGCHWGLKTMEACTAVYDGKSFDYSKVYTEPVGNCTNPINWYSQSCDAYKEINAPTQAPGFLNLTGSGPTQAPGFLNLTGSGSTQAPTQETTQEPTQEPTQAPTQVQYDASLGALTETPTPAPAPDASTEAPVDANSSLFTPINIGIALAIGVLCYYLFTPSSQTQPKKSS